MDAQNQANTVDDHYHIAIPGMDHPISVPTDLGLEAASRVARATYDRAKESAQTLGREYGSAQSTLSQLPSAVYNAATQPLSEEEKAALGIKGDGSVGERIAGHLFRLAGGPSISEAARWYKSAAQGKIPDAVGQALTVAPEAIGTAGAQAIIGRAGQEILAPESGVKPAAKSAPAVEPVEPVEPVAPLSPEDRVATAFLRRQRASAQAQPVVEGVKPASEAAVDPAEAARLASEEVSRLEKSGAKSGVEGIEGEGQTTHEVNIAGRTEGKNAPIKSANQLSEDQRAAALGYISKLEEAGLPPSDLDILHGIKNRLKASGALQEPVGKGVEASPVLKQRAGTQISVGHDEGTLFDRHTANITDPKGNPAGSVEALADKADPNLWIIRSARSNAGAGAGVRAYVRLAEEAQKAADKSGKAVTLRGDTLQSGSAQNVWRNELPKHGYDVAWEKGSLPDSQTPSITFKPKSRYPQPRPTFEDVPEVKPMKAGKSRFESTVSAAERVLGRQPIEHDVTDEMNRELQ